MTSSDAQKGVAPALDFSATKAALWLSLTAFLALLVSLLRRNGSGCDVGVRRQHVHPRVRPRRPPSPRLPLPLSARDALQTMEKQIIGRGLLAGALAECSRRLREDLPRTRDRSGDRLRGRHCRRARSDGSGRGRPDSRAAGGELFTRGIQSTVGMGFGVLLFSVAMGALFAVVFAVAYGRFGNVSARVMSVLVAGAMLISLWIVPALKYPPNPPATSDDATIFNARCCTC